MTRYSRVSWTFAAAALLLMVAFLYGPAQVSGGGQMDGPFRGAPSPDAVSDGFVAYWQAGAASLPNGLQGLVDYWQRYHVAKAVIAALLTVVLSVLALRLWRTYAGPDARRRGVLGCAGVAATLLAGAAALVVMANVQGAIAPLSSVVSLLPSATVDSPLERTELEVVQELASAMPRPALTGLTNDFANYHWVVAVGSGVLACIALALCASAFRSYAVARRSGACVRRSRAVVAMGFAVLATGMVILVVANVGSALDPGRALSLFFSGTSG